MSTESLRKRAYHVIQGKILSGALPAGEKVSELALADEIGISRTPVRSAIRELEMEGLVKQVPRYGTIVKRLGRRELSELYDLRVALEGFAIEQAAECFEPGDLHQLEIICEKMRPLVDSYRGQTAIDDTEVISSFVEADMQFHLVILKAVGNRQLMRSVAGSRMLSHWGRFARKQHDVQYLAGAWEQHARILQVLKTGDSEQSRLEMISHIRSSK